MIRFSPTRVLLRLLLPLVAAACFAPRLRAQTTYRNRADSVVAFFARLDTPKDYFPAIARLRTGEGIPRALAAIDTLLKAPPENPSGMLLTMAVYLHGGDRLPAAYRERIREIWRTFSPVRGDAEHERVMYAAALHLAAARFPDAAGTDWFNGRSSKENRADADDCLRNWFAEATEQGMDEFDSPTVTGDFLAALFLLYDFTPDAGMKKQAEIMIDWLVADFAAEYLRGMYCGAHSREAESAVIQPRLSAMTAFGSMLFGDVPMAAIGSSLLAALSGWEPPEILRTIALSRAEPYIQREVHQSRAFLRGPGPRKRPVFKYTYMTPLYALGSLDGGLIQPVEQHSWDVSWITGEQVSGIFSVQPVASDTLLAQFSPMDEQTTYREIAAQYTRYQTFNKNSDGSPYERIFQHKNTLIALYDIPPIKTFPVVTAFFPNGLDEFIVDSLKSRWIFCRAGDVYVAYLPMQGYVLLKEENGRRLVSPVRTNGLICQVSSRQESGSFPQFMAKVKKSKADLKNLESGRRVRYTTISGETMEFAFDGARRVNGAEAPMDREQLFQSRWMQCRRGTGVLTLTDGARTLVLDMKRREIRTK